jgi:2-hydroxychromene-2-carboxylate isomerase
MRIKTYLKKASLGELSELQKQVSEAIKAKRQAVAKAKAKVMAIAASLGMNTKELTALARGRGPDKAPRQTKARRAAIKATRGRIGKNGEAHVSVH